MMVDDQLKDLAKQISVCMRCDLCKSRTKAVPGEGPSDSRIMFIGEGPGFHEDQQGRPFVGASGKFLNELLENAGLARDQVFITNVVKCRPPGNRDPQEDELLACDYYLETQMELIKPSIIVTLGRFSMIKFFGNVKISQIHGQAKMVNGCLIVAMFHPAAALHQPALKNTIIEDFKKLPQYLKNVPNRPSKEKIHINIQENKADYSGDGTQLPLF